MVSTIPVTPLTVDTILRHRAAVYADSVIETFDGSDTTQVTCGETAARIRLLASGLQRLASRSARGSERSCGTPRSTSRRTSQCPLAVGYSTR